MFRGISVVAAGLQLIFALSFSSLLVAQSFCASEKLTGIPVTKIGNHVQRTALSDDGGSFVMSDLPDSGYGVCARKHESAAAAYRSVSCGSLAPQVIAAADPQQLSQSSSSSMPDAPLPEAQNKQAQDKEAVTVLNTPVHILKDQAAIWTSPLRIRTHDLEWLAPLAVATGASIATDHHVMASVVSHDPGFNHANVDASNALIGGFIAAPVALYGFGHFRDDAHAREAGILGGEALVDGGVVEQGMKLIFWRERPALHNARGLFFQSSAGSDSSFPSSHSVLAWSAAAVMAEEYPSRWSQLGIYSLATGVSLTRVLGQEHFPTDVLIGSACGWLIGHYVYRAHHQHSSTARR